MDKGSGMKQRLKDRRVNLLFFVAPPPFNFNTVQSKLFLMCHLRLGVRFLPFCLNALHANHLLLLLHFIFFIFEVLFYIFGELCARALTLTTMIYYRFELKVICENDTLSSVVLRGDLYQLI